MSLTYQKKGKKDKKKILGWAYKKFPKINGPKLGPSLDMLNIGALLQPINSKLSQAHFNECGGPSWLILELSEFQLLNTAQFNGFWPVVTMTVSHTIKLLFLREKNDIFTWLFHMNVRLIYYLYERDYVKISISILLLWKDTKIIYCNNLIPW